MTKKDLKDKMCQKEVFSYLYGVEGKVNEVRHVSGDMTFCGERYDMTFLVQEEDKGGKRLSESLGFCVSGIIGTCFMAEHNWMIDFGKQEIVIPDSDISSSM